MTIKKIILTIALLTGAIASVSAQEMSEGLANYLDACRSLLKGIETKSFEPITDARLGFREVSCGSLDESSFVVADEKSRESLALPKILFTKDFAEDLIKSGVINVDNYISAHAMRETFPEVNLYHASIKPHSSATFNVEAAEDCETLLISPSGSNLRLVCKDHEGKTAESKSLEGNSIWYSSFTLPAEISSATYTVINDGDEETTFVIALI